jgi:hypothetical protein
MSGAAACRTSTPKVRQLEPEVVPPVFSSASSFCSGFQVCSLRDWAQVLLDVLTAVPGHIAGERGETLQGSPVESSLTIFQASESISSTDDNF